jgi:hypothetical protein
MILVGGGGNQRRAVVARYWMIAAVFSFPAGARQSWCQLMRSL